VDAQDKPAHDERCQLASSREALHMAPTLQFTFPKSFRTQDLAANGTKLHVRVGGSGPAVVLLHGYGETGDMWLPLAKNLARDRTSAAWASPPSPPAATTRKPKLGTPRQFSTP
jgi:hypothetical protein